MKIDRVWLSQYPKGVPAEIDTSRYTSLAALIDECFTTYSDRTAYSFMGKRLSFAQVDGLSRAFAAYLQSQGLAKGDRVAVMMPNIPQYPVVVAAILRAGYVLVNVNPLYTARELEHQLADASVRALVIVENFAHTFAEIATRTPVEHVVITRVGDLLGMKGWLINAALRYLKKAIPPYRLPDAISFGSAIALGEKALPLFQEPDIGPDDIALLQYTGGTTGISKGAVLLHRNLLANVLQINAWFQPALKYLPKNEQIVMACALPLYHIFAFTINLTLNILIGGQNVLIPDPRNMPAMFKALGRQPFHVFPGVNTLFNAILNHPAFPQQDWRALKLTVGGGMPVTQTTSRAWLEHTGCNIVEGYGLSEASPVVAGNRVDITADTPYHAGIGLPMPSTELFVLDDQGHPVATGEVGELAVRGPQVMAGYWQRPDETAKVLTPDGLLHTGDIGVMDETGWFRIVDRKKDMILVSGFNVYPNEVEDVVSSLAGVAECAAIGVPDDRSGEAVKLFVVRRDPALSEADVRRWCRTELTGYKRPRTIEFRDSLPKTPVGKIMRRQLREEAAAEASGAAVEETAEAS